MQTLTTDIRANLKIILSEIGTQSPVAVKEFIIGKTRFLNAALIYNNGMVSKDMLNRDVLNPLMLQLSEDLNLNINIPEYLSRKYISLCNTVVRNNLEEAISGIKTGKAVLIIDKISSFILIDAAEGNYRSISEPVNEPVIRGPREGFIENINTNIGILRRRIKSKYLTVEKFIIGRHTQTELALVYLKDIVDDDVLNEIRKRISVIDIDGAAGIGAIEQYIENHPYSPFPQTFGTERADKIQANLMEGRVAIILDNVPFVITAPAIFEEFFQAVEDYNQRSIVSSVTRFLRMLNIFIVITLPAIYLTFVKYNSELFPINSVVPLVLSRKGILLSPFLEILAMEIVVEVLREGGLRLPGKVGQVLSVVGGLIIGDAAIRAKFASPTTLLILGITVVATFVIPNYDMAIAIRVLRFPILILSEMMGMFGIALGWYFIIVHICSLESFGVPYFSINKPGDFKDLFIRTQFWKMNKRPESIPNKDPVRQSDFRYKWLKGRKDSNEKGRN
ncbi:spore germination protein [Clostridium sp. YIM B02515]|uniref:Spore germination protein n=1 Tax=Clostridium rhizosphaerae TaxID=2803861 RepID=A0ABS1TD37_9CLOT|nr:spore germination protein [Clostridium rhizosphaerae]MBL4937269.1 spore germination protein [Clostridium rhizosphaerae]